MRIRSVKPEFWRDPDTTGRWPADLKLFYIGLWCVVDDEGRFAWDEDLIGSDIFPFDRGVDVGAYLARLVEAGVVVQYEVDGRMYGLAKNFKKHQKISHPTPSRLPPPGTLRESSRSAQEKPSPDQGSGIRDQGAVIRYGGEAPPEASTAPDPAVWEVFRDHLADRMAVPRDWLRVASADRTAQVRAQLDAEVTRLGLARAVEVAAEAATKAKTKPRWLAYFIGALQDAPRNVAPQDAWQDGPHSTEWRDEHGRTLREIQAAEAAQAAGDSP